MSYRWREMKKPDCDSCSYIGTHFSGNFNKNELNKKLAQEAPKEKICRNLAFYLNRVSYRLDLGHVQKEVEIKIDREKEGCVLFSETHDKSFLRTVKPSKLNVVAKTLENLDY